MSLFLIVALPFLGALLPGVMVHAGRRTCAIVTLCVTLTALAGLLVHVPAVYGGEVVMARVAWVPALGLDAAFFLDGLGLFFAALILGMGALIIVYARYYLGREDPMGQFFTYLLLFQGVDGGHRPLRQRAAAAGLLGADVAHVVPADRLLEPSARGAAGRAHGAGRHRAWAGSP